MDRHLAGLGNLADAFQAHRRSEGLGDLVDLIRASMRGQRLPTYPGSSRQAPSVPTASQAYTKTLREQAMPGTEQRAPRREPQYPPYQWGGLHGAEGLGVAGPYGAIPTQKLDAGTYEVSGTQVFLRDSPDLQAIDKGAFNNDYGDNGGIVVGTPDQIDFDGQTADADGHRWMHVTAKTGTLAGQTGYVAAKYVAPVGWTAQQGKTAPVPSAPPNIVKTKVEGGGGGPVVVEPSEGRDWKPWLIGGLVAAAVLGGGYVLFGTKAGKKVRRRVRARARLGRIRRGRRTRRAYA